MFKRNYYSKKFINTSCITSTFSSYDSYAIKNTYIIITTIIIICITSIVIIYHPYALKNVNIVFSLRIKPGYEDIALDICCMYQINSHNHHSYIIKSANIIITNNIKVSDSHSVNKIEDFMHIFFFLILSNLRTSSFYSRSNIFICITSIVTIYHSYALKNTYIIFSLQI